MVTSNVPAAWSTGLVEGSEDDERHDCDTQSHQGKYAQGGSIANEVGCRIVCFLLFFVSLVAGIECLGQVGADDGEAEHEREAHHAGREHPCGDSGHDVHFLVHLHEDDDPDQVGDDRGVEPARVVEVPTTQEGLPNEHS